MVTIYGMQKKVAF